MTTSTAGVLPAFLTGALALRIGRSIPITERELGAALALYFILGGLIALPGGRAADRLGWRAVTLVAAAISASGLVVVASASRTWVLVCGLALGGVAMGVSGPVSNLVLADELPKDRLAFSFGVKQASVPIATFLAGLSVPTLALTLGWRSAFLAGLLAPAVVVGLALMGTSPRRTAGRRRPQFSVDGPLLQLATTGGLGMVATGALGTFLVTSLVEGGIAEATAGLLYAAASLLGLAVRVSGGWMADRRSSEGLRPAVALLALGTLGFLLLASRAPIGLVVGTFLAYGAGWGWSGLFLFSVVHRYPGRAAAATGTVQAGLATGAALGPLLFGAAVDVAGHDAAWGLIAVCTLTAAIVGRRVLRREAGEVA